MLHTCLDRVPLVQEMIRSSGGTPGLCPRGKRYRPLTTDNVSTKRTPKAIQPKEVQTMGGFFASAGAFQETAQSIFYCSYRQYTKWTFKN